MTDDGASDSSPPHSTRTILVAGTASHVGKSTVAAGLSRLLADRGFSVAPFKAQNMSNNARAVPIAPAVAGSSAERGGDAGDADTVTDAAFGEIGVSQYVQARAARVTPTTDHNPVLLKPRGEGESQLVVNGRPAGNHAASDYYEEGWHRARDAAEAAHARLGRQHDVVIAEGAGSIAEINLHHRDLANVETTRFADADVLLVADIERGGVFASLVGTLELVPDDVRDRIAGAVITKFRGDESLLSDGLDAFEERTGVPVLGVLPYDDPGLPEEDSVSLPAIDERAAVGASANESEAAITIAVPRLPRVSNATDLEPLAAEPGVRVEYVPLDADLSSADAVVLPGSKNTADDLRACREAGLHDRLHEFSGPIVGLCGGYQLLGERLRNVGAESVRGGDELPGFGLLPVETRFSTEKRVAPVRWRFDGTGPFDEFAGTVSGYEIHTGETSLVADADTLSGADASPNADTLSDAGTPVAPFVADGRADATLGIARGRVLGTYLHGLFENDEVRDAFCDHLFAAAGKSRPTGDELAVSPYDRAAALVSRLDLEPLGFEAVGDD
ncbi:cobyric acid synthase [Halogeometricum borinquense DSM 11551]|uniref:Probable cobyric acid synthase n=1 Tax=Halogeometricum borinquense (strain ATCC 700274 / DSM 11551 / JCM 10706 / KCTC 4070 / PR3) TaxID=469382 RepID=E4NT63_HALBP|nr:cobyric acid synthase [Halogeometricum borinquense]ADQ68160.1 adenosylcobyric acid synthase (glutamine-hydrolysing) [Halogeometricum borinquense DSM 11551]ELY24796.1 cobyric acid synthase [Halogeometricum borinquense DSM 11551]